MCSIVCPAANNIRKEVLQIVFFFLPLEEKKIKKIRNKRAGNNLLSGAGRNTHFHADLKKKKKAVLIIFFFGSVPVNCSSRSLRIFPFCIDVIQYVNALP